MINFDISCMNSRLDLIRSGYSHLCRYEPVYGVGVSELLIDYLLCGPCSLRNIDNGYGNNNKI